MTKKIQEENQEIVETPDENLWNDRLFSNGNAAVVPDERNEDSNEDENAVEQSEDENAVEQSEDENAVEQSEDSDETAGKSGKKKDNMKPHIFTMRIEDGKMERIDEESTDIEQMDEESEQIDYENGEYLDRKTLATALNVTPPTILNMINDYLTPEEKEYLVIMTYRGLKKKYYHRPEILKILKERLQAERKKRATKN